MVFLVASATSCPVRGTWIEITKSSSAQAFKYRRAPYGARGLKLTDIVKQATGQESCPVRGTWIEIKRVP